MSSKRIDADLDGDKSACTETTPDMDECVVCGETTDIKRCGKCKLISYCSKECQRLDSDNHQVYCSAIVNLQKIETDKLYGDRTVRQKQLDWKTQRKLVKLVGEKPTLRCKLDEKEFDLLWDTGSMVSLVGRNWVREHYPDEKIYSVSEFFNDNLSVRAANSTEVKYDGVVLLDFSLNGLEGEGFVIPVLVASDEIVEPILGYNVIEHLIVSGTDKHHETLGISLGGKRKGFEVSALTTLIQERAKDPDFLTEVTAATSIVIPAGRRIQMRCRVKANGNDKEQTVYFSPIVTPSDEDLTFSETVSQLRRGRTNYVTVDVMNLTNVDKELHKGRVIGSMHGVSAVIPMTKLINAEKKKKIIANIGTVDAGVENSGAVDVDVEAVDVGDNEEEGAGGWNLGDVDLSHLSDQQQNILRKVLQEEKEVFSESDLDIGDIPDLQMPIHLVDEIPVNAAYRKIPPNLYKEVKDYVDDLQTNGWIRESYSSYSSPIVVVRKKCGGMRMCIDYRKLNAKTIPDSQPIPRIQDILDSLGGQKWFTTLDLSKAYHQGYIGEKYRHLTAFCTPWALMEWIRIPFGLRNAPPAFQRFINNALGDLKGSACEPYLDDILCYGQTFEEHIKNLVQVLKRLRARGVKLRGSKCVFAKKEVRYLGRLISENGYRPDPEDTAALDKFNTPPKNVGELRSLLGFIGYYRCYVKDFSIQVKPLYDLLKKREEEKGVKGMKGKKSSTKKGGQRHDSKDPIEWKETHQNILDKIITHLKSPEVIAYPEFEKPFFMTCDASNQGLGAVLYQTQEGVDRVISYASRTLSDAEKNYHMHSGKLEFLAMKWAITERFADYLRYGKHSFKVYTDNNPLTYVLTTAKLNAVGQRWVNELADFNFEIKYKPGKENVDADYLSRRPRDIKEMKQLCTETVSQATTGAVHAWVKEGQTPTISASVSVNSLTLKPDGEITKVSAQELRQKQDSDEVVGPVLKAVLLGSRPSRKGWAELNQGSKLLMRNFKKLFVRDGVLMRRTTKYEQIVLPKEFHQLVYVELHVKLAHLGVDKVVDLAQQRFYWPRMASDIKNHIQKRCRCIVNKKPNQQERAPLVPVEATHPFEMVSIDYMGLDTCRGGFRYAMVVTDHFTRFCQIYATRNKSSKAAADKMFNEFIMQFGYPERIHHDQGPEFTSKLFGELHRLTRIKASKTTPYHPEGNGQAERFNRTVCNMLKALPKPAKQAWNKQLPKLAFAYNSTINKTTGFSPMKLMFGRESRLPIDLVFQVRTEELQRKTHEEFVEQWQDSMQQAMDVALKNIRKSAEYNKRYHDRKAKAVEIGVGDMVLVKNVREKGGTGKLKSYWEESIFKVLEKRDGMPVYKIKNLKKSTDVRTVHRNLIMKCDELPLDIFDDGEGKNAAEARKKAGKVKEKKKNHVNFDLQPTTEETEYDSDDIAVLIQMNGDPSGRGEVESVEPEPILSVEEVEEIIEEDIEEVPEAHHDDGENGEDSENQDSEVTVGDAASSEGSETDESEEERVQPRRPSRHKPKEMFTFERLGGNPSYRKINSGVT